MSPWEIVLGLVGAYLALALFACFALAHIAKASDHPPAPPTRGIVIGGDNYTWWNGGQPIPLDEHEGGVA